MFIEVIKKELENLTVELKSNFADNFNQEVAKLNFRTFIFKAKSNNLTKDDLKKTIDTPQKVIDLANELNINEIPIRRIASR